LPVFLALLFLAGLPACSLRLSGPEEAPALSREEECRAQMEELQARLASRETVEATRMDLVALFGEVPPDCDTADALFRAALRKGRKNGTLLSALAYAVYAGELSPRSPAGRQWQSEVWKDEIRKAMLERTARLRRLARRGRVPRGLYERAVRDMVEFAVWNLDRNWLRRSPAEFPTLDPAEIRVEDLELLTHSMETLRVYFSRYAGEGILGNLRNFETMRGHLERLMAEEDEEALCGFAASMAEEGIRVLDLEAPYALQTGVDKFDGRGGGASTTSPSFLRKEDSPESVEDLLIQVPTTREEPYRVWPGGVTYLLRRTPGAGRGERIVQARVDWGEEEVSPRIRVLRLLGKVGPGKPDLLTVGLRNPEVYRMVTYIDTETFRRIEQDCGVRLSSVGPLSRAR